jgi:hypothetical protein
VSDDAAMSFEPAYRINVSVDLALVRVARAGTGKVKIGVLRYCTSRVKFRVWLLLPDVAVTTRV